MNSKIKIVYDQPRGCGMRKTGGLYLMGDGIPIACGRLPIPLETCPCCGFGIKPSRGFTWIDADKFIQPDHNVCETGNCEHCPIFNILEKGIGMAGLLWVGEKFYSTPAEFAREATRLGISRRISTIPKDFVVGETWILLAHRKAIAAAPEFGKEPEYTAGVFQMFKPSRIEIICDGTESDEIIDGYIKRGLVPVFVKFGNQPQMQPQLQKADQS